MFDAYRFIPQYGVHHVPLVADDVTVNWPVYEQSAIGYREAAPRTRTAKERRALLVEGSRVNWLSNQNVWKWADVRVDPDKLLQILRDIKL